MRVWPHGPSRSPSVGLPEGWAGSYTAGRRKAHQAPRRRALGLPPQLELHRGPGFTRVEGGSSDKPQTPRLLASSSFSLRSRSP